MYNAYKTIKSVLCVICGIMFLFFAGRHYLRSREDARPMPVNAADVSQVASDHHWLAVTGRLVARSAVERTFHGKYNDTYVVYVPLVGPKWNATQPVHAIVLFDGGTRADAVRAARSVMRDDGSGDNWQGTITGTQDSFGRADLFPTLRVADDAILIRHGSTPLTGNQMFLMAGLGVLGVAGGGARLARLRNCTG